jgi:stress-induced-phosphoprotein 1
MDGNKSQAEELKKKGNEVYKQRKFEEAVELYAQAAELDPDNMLLLTNKAAALFEMGKYDESIKECEKALEVGGRNRAPFGHVAKAFVRMGNCNVRLENFAEAIRCYEKALTNERDAATLDLLRKAEKLKEEKDKRDYLSPELSLKAREEGNQHFKTHQFPEAVKAYTEAIKRNPEEPINYSNRAAAYTKLMALPEAIRDCDEAIRLKPDFVKAFIRKGYAQFLSKEYQKCMVTYQEGLKIAPDNPELRQGLQDTLGAINERSSSGKTDEDTLRKAMADPEIQKILSDPGMQKVLQDMQTDPKAAQHYLRQPDVLQKLEKLIAAGIIGVK